MTSPPSASGTHRGRRHWRTAVLEAFIIVAVFALVGAGAGWLWWSLWDQPAGVVSQGRWYTSETGLRAEFAGVGWYVAIATVAGLLLGTLFAWLPRRSELVTLVAVVVGSIVAGYLMLQVGMHLSPDDPQQLARDAADGTELPGALRVASWPPRGAFPFGALAGLVLVFVMSTRTPEDPPVSTTPY